MEREQLQECAALYALGALDGEELQAVQKLLADSEALRKEIAAFAGVAGLLALSAPAARPDPALKERLLQRIRDRAGRASTTNAPPPAGMGGPDSPSGLTFLRDAAAEGWQRLPVPGALVKLLSLDEARGVAVVLGKLEPGARYPSHRHHGPEDVYMITGDLHIGDEVLRAGDFHHAEAGSVHGVNHSEQGCTILVVLTTQDLNAQLQIA